MLLARTILKKAAEIHRRRFVITGCEQVFCSRDGVKDQMRKNDRSADLQRASDPNKSKPNSIANPRPRTAEQVKTEQLSSRKRKE